MLLANSQVPNWGLLAWLCEMTVEETFGTAIPREHLDRRKLPSKESLAFGNRCRGGIVIYERRPSDIKDWVLFWTSSGGVPNIAISEFSTYSPVRDRQNKISDTQVAYA